MNLYNFQLEENSHSQIDNLANYNLLPMIERKKTRATTEGICWLGLPSLGIHVYTKLFNPICSIKLQQEFVQ